MARKSGSRLEQLLREVAAELRPDMPVGRTMRFLAGDVDDPTGRLWEFFVPLKGAGFLALEPRQDLPLSQTPLSGAVKAMPLADDEASVLRVLADGPLQGKGVLHRLKEMGEGRNFSELKALLSSMRNIRGLLDWTSRGYSPSAVGTASLLAYTA